MNSEAVVVLLGNGPDVEQITVPFSRVIDDPGNGTDGSSFIETDMVRNYILLLRGIFFSCYW